MRLIFARCGAPDPELWPDVVNLKGFQEFDLVDRKPRTLADDFRSKGTVRTHRRRRESRTL